MALSDRLSPAAGPRPLVKPALLQALVAVAETGSFSRGAAHLDVTQSAVSRSVAELERELGVRLLRRTSQGAHLTPAGERVLERARHILTLLDLLHDDARASGEITGTVRIACFRSVATHLLPPLMARTRLAYPQVRLEIHDACLERADVERAVLTGRADFGVGQLPADPRLVASPLLTDEYLLVTNAADPAPLPLAGPYLQHGLTALPAITQALKALGLPSTPAMSLSEETSILALVERGLGFSVLPRLVLPAALPGVRLQAFPGRVARTLGVLRLPSGARSPAARLLLAAVLDAAHPAAVPQE